MKKEKIIQWGFVAVILLIFLAQLIRAILSH